MGTKERTQCFSTLSDASTLSHAAQPAELRARLSVLLLVGPGTAWNDALSPCPCPWSHGPILPDPSQGHFLPAAPSRVQTELSMVTAVPDEQPIV